MNRFVNVDNARGRRFMIPTSFQSQYRTREHIGTGGYGSVFRLINTNRKGVAVKKYITPFFTPQKLSHYRILRRYLYMLLAMETRGNHRFKLEDFKRMISELLRALKYINSSNVIHRDLKPDNLAIDEKGKLTLLDFGLSRVINRNNEMTSDPGQKYYRAIETVEFRDKIPKTHRNRFYNEKADIWSIGAILCEMITGRILFKDYQKPLNHDYALLNAIPFCGQIPEKVLMKIDHETNRKTLRARSANVPRADFLDHLMRHGRDWLQDDIRQNSVELVDFINRTLVYDPDERMSVDEALAHPFLASVRKPSKEVVAKHTIRDVKNRSIRGWKRLIWHTIRASAARRTTRRRA